MKNYEKIQAIKYSGNGHYQITIQFRNKNYSAIVTDMQMIDNYKSINRGWKDAGNRLYDTVVRKNNLR